jgi:lactoylglutathione lyase
MRNFLTALFLLLSFSCAMPVSSAAETGIGGIDQFGLAVTDLQTSQKFFVDALGFDLIGEDSEYPSAFVTNG